MYSLQWRERERERSPAHERTGAVLAITCTHTHWARLAGGGARHDPLIMQISSNQEETVIPTLSSLMVK